MAFDFPSAPTEGQEFTPTVGVTYVFYDPRWIVKPLDATKAYVDAQDALKVSKTGSTMTGELILSGVPSNSLGAVSKNYVDTEFVPSGGGTMTGNLIINAGASTLFLQNSTASGAVSIKSYTSANQRWQVTLGNPASESTANAGSDLVISRFADNGVAIDQPLTINRASGGINITTHAGFGVASGGNPVGQAGNVATGVQINANGYIYVSGAGGGTTLYSSFNVNSDSTVIQFDRSGAIAGTISVSGFTTAYNTSSDKRLKEDLKPFDAGHIIDETVVYDFKWKDTKKRAYGVVAQEAVKVYDTPTFYDEENDRYLIDYSKYVPVLLQELKSLRARVATLEGKPEVKSVSQTKERKDADEVRTATKSDARSAQGGKHPRDTKVRRK